MCAQVSPETVDAVLDAADPKAAAVDALIKAGTSLAAAAGADASQSTGVRGLSIRHRLKSDP